MKPNELNIGSMSNGRAKTGREYLQCDRCSKTAAGVRLPRRKKEIALKKTQKTLNVDGKGNGYVHGEKATRTRIPVGKNGDKPTKEEHRIERTTHRLTKGGRYRKWHQY